MTVISSPIDSLDVAYKICTVLAVAGGFTWTAIKFIGRKSAKVIDGAFDRRTAASVARSLAALDEKATAIQCEVKPNGGNSLKDLQVKQMDRFEALDKVLATILQKLNGVESRVANIENKQAQAKIDLDSKAGIIS